METRLVRPAEKAGDRTCDPWFTSIYNHGGSYFDERPCHTTTYSTSVYRRMINSVKSLVYAEEVRDNIYSSYEHVTILCYCCHANFVHALHF